MVEETDNVTPSRQMSGRRSKPSMDLLVDNQRILSQYIVPPPRPRKETPKINKVVHPPSLQQNADSNNVTNHKEKSSVLPLKKQSSKPQNVKTPEGQNKLKRKISSALVNGSDAARMAVSLDGAPYVTLKLKKVEVPAGPVSPDGREDDLPLSEAFPGYRPPSSPQKRPSALSLPPKKKMRYASGAEEDLETVPAPPVASPPKSDVLALPRIPKKARIDGEASQDGQARPAVSSPPPTPSHTSITILTRQLPKTDLVPAPEAPQEDQPPQETPPRATDCQATRRCAREPACTNLALDDPRWHKEFCSPDCAVLHCRTLFADWLQARAARP